MDELVHRFFGDGDDWPAAGYAPPVDMTETDDTVRLRIDIPGVDPDKIDVELRQNRLHIEGQREEGEAAKGETILRHERRTGPFSRTIALPCPVKEDKIDAKCASGVLTVSIPKAETAKTRKVIIKS
jgi:HSP20 family protein